MNPRELTIAVTVLANMIAQDLSADELDVAAAVFTQLGDTLATISVQRTRTENRIAPTPSVNEDGDEAPY